MKRLAIVCRDARGLGGTTRTLVEHARAFVDKGWSVDVLAYKVDPERFGGSGAGLRRVPGIPWGSWLKRRLFAAAADRMGKAYDLVHGHGDNLRQDALSLHNCVHAAHLAIHGTPLPESNAVGRLHEMQLRGRLFKILIANSRLMADDVQRRFDVPAEMIRVIHPGHDPEKFGMSEHARLRAEARAELGLGQDELILGLITSGDFEKRGVGCFLRAVHALKNRGLNFKALIVGKENRLEPYLKLVRELGLIDRVRFREPRLEVERFYHCLDVYCHPALYEEFGQSVQEAMACGLPIVCGRKVGATELFTPSMKELLADPSSDELSAKLALVIENEALRRRLGSDGPGAVAANTWQANAAATIEVLVGKS